MTALPPARERICELLCLRLPADRAVLAAVIAGSGLPDGQLARLARRIGENPGWPAVPLSGMVAYNFLPLSTLPQVDYPTIQVQTFLPGGSPDVMTTSVTAPLEKQFGQMPGLKEMSSISSAGSSVITLQFDLSSLGRPT